MTDIRRGGYLIDIPLFVRAEKDLRVLLTTHPTASECNDNCYEIAIDISSNALNMTRRKQPDKVLLNANYENALQMEKQNVYLIRITTG